MDVAKPYFRVKEQKMEKIALVLLVMKIALFQTYA